MINSKLRKLREKWIQIPFDVISFLHTFNYNLEKKITIGIDFLSTATTFCFYMTNNNNFNNNKSQSSYSHPGYHGIFQWAKKMKGSHQVFNFRSFSGELGFTNFSKNPKKARCLKPQKEAA